MADEIGKRHWWRQTIGGGLILLSIPIGIYVGFKIRTHHGTLIGLVVGAFIPCITILAVGMALEFATPKKSR